MSHLVPLGAEDASRIAELAARHYPGSFALSEDDVAENLREGTAGLCQGLLERDRLVGYLLAWPQTSLIESSQETVIVVDDLVLEPDYRSQLFACLRGFVEALEAGPLAGLAIEAAVRVGQGDLFLKHPRPLEKLGYQVVASHAYFDEELGEELIWIRLEPLA